MTRKNLVPSCQSNTDSGDIRSDMPHCVKYCHA